MKTKTKSQERNRFEHLEKELLDLKAGKTRMKVTTVDPFSNAMTVHYETYEEMQARHKTKPKAAAEFKQLRQSVGLTQKAAAEALRVSPRTLQGWESSRCPINPTAETFLRVIRTHPEILDELLVRHTSQLLAKETGLEKKVRRTAERVGRKLARTRASKARAPQRSK